MGELSSFLYSRPSAVEGLARILDFGDTLTEYNRSQNGAVADYFALASDWAMVGEDLYQSVQYYERQASVEEEKTESL